MSKKGLKKKTKDNLKIYKFSPENIINGAKKNIENFFQNLKKDKSVIFNSENIKNVYLSSTMSPSLKINFKDIQK